MRKNFMLRGAAGPKKSLAFSKYRHIPKYEESMALVTAERDRMLDLIHEASSGESTPEGLIAEIARNAADMCVSFDEALYLRWRYCRDQMNARQRIAALRDRIGAGGGA